MRQRQYSGTAGPATPGNWYLGEGRAILKGVPGSATGYGGSRWDRYLRWQERLTLKQYALSTGVLIFITATVVAVLVSAVGLSQGLGFAVVFVPTMTVGLTAFWTWWRWDALRNKRERDRRDQQPGTPGH